jgi:hypothetical protein
VVGAALVAGLAGLGLMVPFEGPLARTLGMACLFAFIVLGLFAVASPEYLGKPPEGDDEGGGRPRQVE